jgi:hypothetical protein
VGAECEEREGGGGFFLDFNSRTYRKPSSLLEKGARLTGGMYFSWIVDSEKSLAFPTCREPRDVMHLPNAKEVRISFTHCRLAKQWIRTLGPSGALGVGAGIELE